MHTYVNILPPFGDTVVSWLSPGSNAVILKKEVRVLTKQINYLLKVFFPKHNFFYVFFPYHISEVEILWRVIPLDPMSWLPWSHLL